MSRIVVGILSALALTSPIGRSWQRESIEQYVSRQQGRIFAELVQLLSIPNVAADRPNIRRNADHLRAMLERRGLAVEILETAAILWSLVRERPPGRLAPSCSTSTMMASRSIRPDGNRRAPLFPCFEAPASRMAAGRFP